jgi:hypothetical protein
MVGGPTGFEATWNQILTYLYPTLQMLFWIVVGMAAVYAARQYKRFVDAAVGRPAEESEPTVSVEEFVE